MSTSQHTDEAALWTAYRHGDADALGKLMAAHYRTLFHYGSRFTRDTDRIRDCMQDVFVELWNRRETLRPLTAGQVKPYLMTMLRRLLHEQYLEQNRYSFRAIDDELDAMPVTFSPEDELIGTELTADNAARIRLLVDTLPQRTKEAIHLRFFDNLDRQAVAQVMGISEQSVSNLIQEAFRSLRRQVRAEQFWLLLLSAWID